MPENTDLVKLYSQQILALAADIPHTARLTAPDASVKRRAPLCGSAITVDVTMKDGRVAQYGQDVRACALGQAAASIVGANAIGRTRAEIETARDQLTDMLKNGGAVPDAPFDGLKVLEPARDYRNRHASILLSLEALSEAVAEAERAHCA